MKKTVIILFFILILGFAFIHADTNIKKIDEKVVQNLKDSDSVNVIITLNNISDKEKDSLINKTLDGKIVHDLDNTISASISNSDLKTLSSSPLVNSIVKDNMKRIFLQDSVPLINATSVWAEQINGTNLTGEGQTVCILDTGVDFTHPDLLGKNLTCVIDCSGKSCVENCSVGDDHGHGTHVAGIVAANGSLRGVAPGANLIGVKVCNSSGYCNSSDILAGFDFCLTNASQYNISVISMSLGSGLYSGYCDGDSEEYVFASPINNAVANNISVVVATGNDASTSGIASPACIQNATRVGDLYKQDYSPGWNWGNPVVCTDINPILNQIVCHANRASFFSDILFTYGAIINSTWNNGSYNSAGGTSMATPHVSGSIALINQYEKISSNKTLTPSEIKTSLLSSGKNVSDSGTSSNYSRVDVFYSILNLDETSPTVTLISPSGNVGNETNQTFSCNATDDLQLSNLTLTIWNSTGIFYQNTTNATSNSLTIYENITLSNETYEWNCQAYDAKGNLGLTSNSTITTVLATSLYSPSNNLSTNQNQTFTCISYSPYNLTNVTLYLWNSTNELIYNETQNISGTSNTTIFYYNFTLEGNYTWNCISEDDSNNVSLAASNYSIFYDITSPNITLNSPSSGYSSTGTQTITFQYNVSENSNTANCSLILNDVFVKSNQTSIQNGTTNNISYSVSPGSYTWKINCFDSAGNEANSSSHTLTLNTPAVPSGGGSSGSSSSSSGVSIPSVIPESQLETGVLRQLYVNNEVSFTLNNETHKIKVNSLTNNTVLVTISSEPFNLTLSLGETRKLDLNSDNFYDLQIYLRNITNSKAELEIKKINEEIPLKVIFDNSTNASPEVSSETPKPSFFKRLIESIKEFLKKIFK